MSEANDLIESLRPVIRRNPFARMILQGVAPLLQTVANNLEPERLAAKFDPDTAPVSYLAPLTESLDWYVGDIRALSATQQRIVLKKIPIWQKYFGQKSVTAFAGRGVIEDIVFEYLGVLIKIAWRGEMNGGLMFGFSHFGQTAFFDEFSREHLRVVLDPANTVTMTPSILDKLTKILDDVLPPMMIFDLAITV
jgi:hypothetical protein